MQITNTDLQQSFNAIFRGGNVLSENQVKVYVQKQGTLDVKEFTPAVINYYPNFCNIEINLTDIPEDYSWKDGEEYMIKVVDYNNVLIYMDTIYVSENGFNPKKQNIPNNDYTTVYDIQSAEERDQQTIDDDYIILND
jgi:hypothetical protein